MSASARSAARRYLQLAQKWRVCEDGARAPERDLGVVVRRVVKEAFRRGEETRLRDPVRCEQVYQALSDLADDAYSKQYPSRYRHTGMLGLNRDDTRFFASDAAMRAAGFRFELTDDQNDNDRGRARALARRLRRWFRLGDNDGDAQSSRRRFETVCAKAAARYTTGEKEEGQAGAERKD